MRLSYQRWQHCLLDGVSSHPCDDGPQHWHNLKVSAEASEALDSWPAYGRLSEDNVGETTRRVTALRYRDTLMACVHFTKASFHLPAGSL